MLLTDFCGRNHANPVEKPGQTPAPITFSVTGFAAG
jgi:hypothetical protein